MAQPPPSRGSTARLDPSSDAGAAEKAAERLRRGELVAFATETVYGLGAVIDHPDAIHRLFTAKERPHTDPLIVHIASPDELEAVAVVDETTRPLVDRLTERWWPGPLTLVLPRHPDVTPLVGGGRPTIGVRQPGHADARRLIASAGSPVAAPSANRFGRISPTSAEHVLAELDGRIDAVLDSGPCPIGIESTVIDLVERPYLLRPGAVTAEELLEEIPDLAVDLMARETAPRAPGRLWRHYAPQTPAILVHRPLIERVDHICDQMGLRSATVGIADEATVARSLYADLRRADDSDADLILLVEPRDTGGLGTAILDRMWRAAEGRYVQGASQLGRIDDWLS